MSNPNISKYGQNTRFSVDKQPDKHGKKPSKLRAYIIDTGLSTVDIKLIAAYFFDRTRKEIVKMAANPDIPVLISGVAKAILADITRGRIDVLSWLVERGFGKAAQPIEHTGGIDPVQGMSYKEREKYLNELIERRRSRANGKENQNDKDNLQGCGGVADKPVISASGESQETNKNQSQEIKK
jgi:hypothetical protein